MVRDILHSTCRYCRKPVIYSYLPRMPEEQGKDRSFRIRSMIWYHKNRPLGEELHCEGVPRAKRSIRNRAAPRDYCSEHQQGSDTWSSGSICNRPVKDFDIFMCGIHARAVHQEKKRREEHERKWAKNNYVFSETVALQKEILDRFGIETNTHYDWRASEYTGLVTINPRELLDALEEMAASVEAVEEQEWEDFV